MISHARSPGDNIRPTTGINCDQNPNTLEPLYSFPRMNVETTDINSINDRTLGPSLAPFFVRNEVAPYLVNNISSENRAQVSTIWMRDSTGPGTGLGSLHYYQPGVLSHSKNAQCLTLPLSEKTNVPALGLPGLLNVSSEEPSSWTMSPQLVLTDVYSPANVIPNLPAETNCALGSPSNTRVQLSSNSAPNRLRHLTSLPCQQDNYNPHFSYEQCNRLSHYGVPFSSNQKDGSITISTACFNQHPTPTTTTNCYSQPQMQATSGIPNQIFPNVYQIDVLPQSILNQCLLESQANSQISNEIQHAHFELSNSCLYTSSRSRICASTCPNKQPFVSQSVPGNTSQEILQNYVNTCLAHETTPLVHQPDDTDINEPCTKSSCRYEKNIKTFPPKVYKEDVERKTVPRNNENRSSYLEKEARISGKPEAQVDELTSSPKKEQKTSVKKWECPVCSRKLARAYCLKIHMRQHSGDRPFKCPVCSRTFAQQNLLLSHRRTHNGKRAHSCPTCHKMFVHMGALKTHVNTHTGVRPHKCPVPSCSVAFADRSTLAKHARVHSGERPFVCDICGRRFTQSGNMNKHKKTVHKAIDSSPMGKTRVLENSMFLSEIFGNTGNKVCTTTIDVPKRAEELINRRVEKSSPGHCVAESS